MMKREECENQIRDLMIKIRDVYKEYNPDGKYLSMCINGDSAWANNSFYSGGADADHPLDTYFDIESREK